jgi:hypothetical protein
MRERRERIMAEYMQVRQAFYTQARGQMTLLTASFRLKMMPIHERHTRRRLFVTMLTEEVEVQRRCVEQFEELKTRQWMARFEEVERTRLMHELAQWDSIFDDNYASPAKLLADLVNEQQRVRGMLSSAATFGVADAAPRDVVGASVARGSYTPAADMAGMFASAANAIRATVVSARQGSSVHPGAPRGPIAAYDPPLALRPRFDANPTTGSSHGVYPGVSAAAVPRSGLPRHFADRAQPADNSRPHETFMAYPTKYEAAASIQTPRFAPPPSPIPLRTHRDTPHLFAAIRAPTH